MQKYNCMENHRFLLVNNKQGLGRFSKNNDFVVVDLLPCPYQPFSHPNSSSSTAPTSRSFSLSLPALVPACPTVRVQQGPGYRSDSLIVLPRQHRGWWSVLIKLCLQVPSPYLCRHAGLTCCAYVFDVSHHSRPVK